MHIFKQSCTAAPEMVLHLADVENKPQRDHLFSGSKHPWSWAKCRTLQSQVFFMPHGCQQSSLAGRFLPSQSFHLFRSPASFPTGMATSCPELFTLHSLSLANATHLSVWRMENSGPLCKGDCDGFPWTSPPLISWCSLWMSCLLWLKIWNCLWCWTL